MMMRKHAKAKKGRAGRSSARSGRKHHKTRKARKAGMRKSHVSKASRKVGKAGKSSKSGRSRSRLHKPHAVRQSKPSVSVSSSPFRKAADEVPTLEQVIITCANCGRPFKLFKLKGLSLEGTICQRCSIGEMELPESFG